MTEVLKAKWFEWIEQIQRAFEKIKLMLISAPILVLLLFSKVFEVKYDLSRVGIGAILSQEKSLMAFFNEKLNDAKRKYSFYDKEFYTIVRALEHWQYYLVGSEFILHSNHKALKFIQSQHKLNPRHRKSVEYLQSFHLMIHHKADKMNKGAEEVSPYLYLGIQSPSF